MSAIAGAIGISVSSGNAPAGVSGVALGVLALSLAVLVWREVTGGAVRDGGEVATLDGDDEGDAMRDLLDQLDRWRDEGVTVALARVVDVDGSGPRDPGAAMAVNERGEVVGSVSGGCVEGAVVAAALEVIATGDRRLLSFGYSDDDAFAVGLSCGGTIHLFVEPLDW